MPKINQEEYDVLKDRIAEEIYSWDGAESGWGDVAVEDVLEILDDFFGKTRASSEKEKLYRVEMHGTTDVALLTLEGDEYYFDEALDYVGERPDIRQEFTESEIKAIDGRYWLFAVEVSR